MAIPLIIVSIGLTMFLIASIHGIITEDFFSSAHEPEKRIPYINERWEILQTRLERNFKHEKTIYDEYDQSSRLEKLFWAPPELTYYYSREILKNHDTPFSVENGSWVLKKEIRDALEGELSKNKDNGIDNGIVKYIQIIACYDAEYMILTNDTKFYQNAFSEEDCKKIYDDTFMNIVSARVKDKVKQDLKSGKMNKKLLKNPIVQRVYQETYVQEKSRKQQMKNSVEDNFAALLALQEKNVLSTEEFIEAFGAEADIQNNIVRKGA